MEAVKISENVEFDVIYADGTRRHVHEGILFEVEEDQMIFHNGTNRAQVWCAAAEFALEIIDSIGLLNIFDSYIRRDAEDSETLRIVTKLSRNTRQTGSAERQAVFRLGQMDMRESIVGMLLDAANGTFGITQAALKIAVDKINELEVL